MARFQKYQYFVTVTMLLLLVLRYFRKMKVDKIPIKLFSVFLKDLDTNKVEKVILTMEKLYVRLKQPLTNGSFEYITILPGGKTDPTYLVQLLARKQVRFGSKAPSALKHVLPLVLTVSPIIYLLIAYRFLSKIYTDDGVGKKSKDASSENANACRKLHVLFSDVAGVDHAKIELEEIVDALNNPMKYKKIGAKMPRGILLCGPSGTGKTLLARALANEAQKHFIYCSASDFVEMLVGRGAARIRELFKRASQNAPCIIFIDELDALAKARGGINSNDEREQTLNQLLTELDGFEGQFNDVLVIAATNRPQILDPALVRPGRFDRHIFVGLPNLEGRESILKVHTRNVKLAVNTSLRKVAEQTPDRSGAEIASLVNDAALLAIREGEDEVSSKHFDMAVQRSVKSKEMFRQSAPFPLGIDVLN